MSIAAASLPGPVLPPLAYDVTELDIQSARNKYAALEATTPAGYEEVRLAIGFLRGTRTAVEKRRKELKADALAYGREVDAMAKALTTLIEGIEAPLQAKKQAVDDEKARARREAEEAERRALEEKIRAERQAEEARLKAERDAEDARLAVERKRLDAERAVLEAAQRQAAAAQREIDERNRRAQEEIAAARRELEAREAEARRAEDVRLQTERDRVAFEAMRVAQAEELNAGLKRAEEEIARAAERAAAETARREALRPDVEKVIAFAGTIRAVAEATSVLGLTTREARARVATARIRLGAIAAALEAPPESWTTPEART